MEEDNWANLFGIRRCFLGNVKKQTLMHGNRFSIHFGVSQFQGNCHLLHGTWALTYISLHSWIYYLNPWCVPNQQINHMFRASGKGVVSSPKPDVAFFLSFERLEEMSSKFRSSESLKLIQNPRRHTALSTRSRICSFQLLLTSGRVRLFGHHQQQSRDDKEFEISFIGL